MWYLIVSIPDLCNLTYFGTITIHLSPQSGFSCCPFKGGGSIVVDSLYIVTPIDCGGSVFGPFFCYTVLSVLSSFAVILMRKSTLMLAKQFCVLTTTESQKKI